MRYWFLLGGILLASAAQAATRVTDVAVNRDPKGWRVDLKATEKSAYTVHVLPSPNRLIIDVPNATLAINSQIKPVSTGGGPALRFSQFTRRPDAVRVVVDLPEGAKWYEISASPAMSIAVLMTTPAAALARPAVAAAPAKPAPPGAAAAKPAVASKPAPPAAKPAPPAAKPAPKVLSARELEQNLLKNGGAPKPAAPKPEPARPPVVARKTTRTAPRSEPSAPSRSSVTSRGGAVDRRDVLEAFLAMPPGSMALPPVGAIEPPAPAWDATEAVALINASECPDPLRRRLIEVVSDDSIRTSQYVWGAETPGQFDCSGLMLYIYSALDVKLPRVSLKQAEHGLPVDRTELRAGDLVFFNTRGKDISHVGIYLGDGRFLHAANPRENLRITPLDSPYYAKRFVTARRVYSPAVANNNIIRQGG